jgi:hypothetical protein
MYETHHLDTRWPRSARLPTQKRQPTQIKGIARIFYGLHPLSVLIRPPFYFFLGGCEKNKILLFFSKGNDCIEDRNKKGGNGGGEPERCSKQLPEDTDCDNGATDNALIYYKARALITYKACLVEDKH